MIVSADVHGQQVVTFCSMGNIVHHSSLCLKGKDMEETNLNHTLIQVDTHPLPCCELAYFASCLPIKKQLIHFNNVVGFRRRLNG